MSENKIIRNEEFLSSDGDDFSFERIVTDSDVEEILPHIVFLIPGIRTDGDWAQQLRYDAQTWAGRPILCKPIRGNGRNTDRLNIFHVATRFGLGHFRSNFKSQIDFVLDKHDAYTVNVVAHSMGGALLSEIISDISQSIISKGYKINRVVLVGSVCHRSHSENIASNCNLFVNDVGRMDIVPFIASVINPFRYGDVGTRGFLDAFVSYDRFFQHDHKSCTSVSHLKSKIIPLIETDHIVEIGSEGSSFEGSRFSANTYVYARRAIWLLIAAIVIYLIF